MERLTQTSKDLKQALSQFSDSITLLENLKNTEAVTPQIIAYRDSVIKRFEICFDLLWKSLKEVLKEKYGQEIASPKKIFRECFTQKLISKNELEETLIMADDRNQTTHTYDNQMAEEVSLRAISHYNLMLKLAKLINV